MADGAIRHLKEQGRQIAASAALVGDICRAMGQDPWPILETAMELNGGSKWADVAPKLLLEGVLFGQAETVDKCFGDLIETMDPLLVAIASLGLDGGYQATLPHVPEAEDLSGRHAAAAAPTRDHEPPTSSVVFSVQPGCYYRHSFFSGRRSSYRSSQAMSWEILTVGYNGIEAAAWENPGVIEVHFRLAQTEELDFEAYWSVNERGQGFWDLKGQGEEATDYDFNLMEQYDVALDGAYELVEPYPEAELPTTAALARWARLRRARRASCRGRSGRWPSRRNRVSAGCGSRRRTGPRRRTLRRRKMSAVLASRALRRRQSMRT